MSALPTGPTPTLYLYEDTCSGGYFLTAERSDTTLHRFVQEVAMPRDALNAAHQAGVEAERARAAAEVGIDEEEFVVRYVMAAAETGRTYAAVHFGDEVNGDGEIETMETVARRAHTIASEMLDESIDQVQS